VKTSKKGRSLIAYKKAKLRNAVQASLLKSGKWERKKIDRGSRSGGFSIGKRGTEKKIKATETEVCKIRLGRIPPILGK